MTTVDQFLKALAMVESGDNPEAWGDAGRAMGRWQVHPDRLFDELKRTATAPRIGQTWDQLVAEVVRTIFVLYHARWAEPAIAMYWHVGHWVDVGAPGWDAKYALRFNAALADVVREQGGGS